MSKRLILLLPLLGFSLFGCSLPAVETQTPEELPALTGTPFQPELVTPLPGLILATPQPESTATLSPDLSFEQLRNAEYITTGLNNGIPSTYRMQDGSYRTGTDSAVAGYATIDLLSTHAFGDLDNDTRLDAVVLLVENYGGTGQFVQVATVLNRDGQPVHSASYFLGDRVAVSNIIIQNNEIILTAQVHGPQDGLCCPSVPASIHLRMLNENQLMLTRFTTRAPSGQERAINIRAPLSGAEASGAITIIGDITIAPFENNLSYTVYDSEYREISRSYLMVDAPDFGAPGTFALTIDLASLGHTGDIYIEITDLSAADGSVLALSQIQLKVR